MMVRTLSVCVDGHRVGVVSETESIWGFDYDPEWAGRADSFDLSPALPRSRLTHLDGGSLRPVQWFFDNLLPEEGERAAAAKDAGIRDVEDSFALLAHLGRECSGCLTLLPQGELNSPDAGISELPNEQLSRRISRMSKEPLGHDAPKRTAIAGAQPKLPVLMLGGMLYEPCGATLSTHILKPDHPAAQAYPASAFNEFVTMRMARAAGLIVPKVSLRYVPQPVYVIERFDRPAARRESRRRAKPLVLRPSHVVDGCQLLNKAGLFKHVGATLESLLSIVDRTTNKLATRRDLFRWLVFNTLVGNDDAHLKNLSFLVDHEQVRLAPHYDLLSLSAYHTQTAGGGEGSWPAVRMAFPLLGAKTFGEVTYEVITEAGRALGLATPVAARITSEVCSKVGRELSSILRGHRELSEADVAARAAYFADEQRLLDVLRTTIVEDMIPRLTRTAARPSTGRVA